MIRYMFIGYLDALLTLLPHEARKMDKYFLLIGLKPLLRLL